MKEAANAETLRGESCPSRLSPSVFLAQGEAGGFSKYQPGLEVVQVFDLRCDRLYILLPHARVHDIQRA